MPLAFTQEDFLVILYFKNPEKHTVVADRSLDSNRTEFRWQCVRDRQCFVECVQSQNLQPSLCCCLSEKCSESSDLWRVKIYSILILTQRNMCYNVVDMNRINFNADLGLIMWSFRFNGQ